MHPGWGCAWTHTHLCHPTGLSWLDIASAWLKSTDSLVQTAIQPTLCVREVRLRRIADVAYKDGGAAGCGFCRSAAHATGGKTSGPPTSGGASGPLRALTEEVQRPRARALAA